LDNTFTFTRLTFIHANESAHYWVLEVLAIAPPPPPSPPRVLITRERCDAFLG
jgi:hypothetical protein